MQNQKRKVTSAQIIVAGTAPSRNLTLTATVGMRTRGYG